MYIASMADTENKTVQAAQDITGPIVAVFGAEDGGVAFAYFRHELLPQLLREAPTNAKSAELLKLIQQFSGLCHIMLRS